MAQRQEWTVNIVSGDVLRRIVAATLPRSEVEPCIAFVCEYASAETIGEDELDELIGAFLDEPGTNDD